MRDRNAAIVINTTPLIALTAATGSLDILRTLYDKVIVPLEVEQEIRAGGAEAVGVAAFEQSTWLESAALPPLTSPPISATPWNRGEASVLQTALDENIATVCIDEAVGRRVARLSGLTLTGSIGILIKARQEGYPVSIREALANMQAHGLWLSAQVVSFALAHDV